MPKVKYKTISLKYKIILYNYVHFKWHILLEKVLNYYMLAFSKPEITFQLFLSEEMNVPIRTN